MTKEMTEEEKTAMVMKTAVEAMQKVIAFAPSRAKIVAEVPKFEGKATDDAMEWMTKLERWMDFNAVDITWDGDRVMYAMNRMTGPAWVWAETLADSMGSKYSEGTGVFGDWNGFKGAFLNKFRGLNRTLLAEQAIRDLYQRTTVVDYTSSFQEQARYLTGWGDAPLITIFRDGLKPRVRTKIYDGYVPMTLGEFINRAIEVDMLLTDNWKMEQGYR